MKNFDVKNARNLTMLVDFYELTMGNGYFKNGLENKIAYLEYKNELEQRDIFNGEETLDFNVYFNIERVDEEITDYSLVIDTPKINMHNVKALLIHNFVNEEAYPSVGIFDSPKELQENSKDKIVLNGHIQTINDISNTKFKLYLEYTDDNNDLNKIYYEVNRG